MAEGEKKRRVRDIRLYRLLADEDLVELWERVEPEIDPETGEEVYPSPEENMRMVLRRVAEVLDRSGNVVNVKRLVDELEFREKQAPTVLGHRIAIPHVRSKNARELTVCFLRFPEGIELPGPEGPEIINFIFGIISPIYEDDTDYQKVYRRLVRLYKDDPSLAQELEEMTFPGEIVRIFRVREL